MDDAFVTIGPFYSRCTLCYSIVERSYEDKHAKWHEALKQSLDHIHEDVIRSRPKRSPYEPIGMTLTRKKARCR